MNFKADSSEFGDDNKIIMFSTREISMSNFIESILQNSHTAAILDLGLVHKIGQSLCFNLSVCYV
jgi:hypothetical protein